MEIRDQQDQAFAQDDRRQLEPGDYVCSDRALYRVEHVEDGRALVEDCRTNGLIAMRTSVLAGLERVQRAAEGSGSLSPTQ